MLRAYAEKYVLIGSKLVWQRQLIASIENRIALETEDEKEGEAKKTIFETAPKELRENEIAEAKKLLEEMEKTCREVNLPVSSELAKGAANDPPRTAREYDNLISALTAELKTQLFLYVPNHLARYYELELPSTLTAAFPLASKEIVSAGNCLASGLYTACVFHSMRAAEIGLRVLGNTLGVSFPNHPIELAEWHNILDQADSKIVAMKQLRKGVHKDEELAFYSQAAVQFRYFKDGWRVRVAHAREAYEENAAIKVFNHTVEFFETLAHRLKEPPPTI